MNLKKMKKSGGFTLIEMLIVVAIIAILVAISIPMVSSSLDKARIATDTANERSAKAAALIEYMENGAAGTYYFDGVAGKLEKKAKPTDGKGYGQCKEHKGDYLTVTIKDNGDVEMYWDKEGDTHSNPTPKKDP